jgi:prefoldin subunit 1
MSACCTDNEPLLKQKRLVKQKKAAQSVKIAEKKITKQLDEQQVKELMELQDQMNANVKDLRTVQAKLAGCQREARATQATMFHVNELDQAVPLYRAVGKAFILTPRPELESRMESDIEISTRNQRDYTDRIEYLERRIASNRQNLKELTAGY